MTTVTAVPILPVKRGYLIWLWAGIALALVSAWALARQADPVLVREQRGHGVIATPSGLQYKVIKAGQPGGATPTDTDVALVNYQGRLLDGTTFDQSQRPMPMPVAGVVPGFGEALKLMHKGAKYRLWMPPKLGYGDRANGPIPANSTLVFDLEMIDFIPAAVLRQLQAQQMQQQQGAPGGMPPGMAPQDQMPGSVR